jgi:hypothetical protein
MLLALLYVTMFPELDEKIALEVRGKLCLSITRDGTGIRTQASEVRQRGRNLKHGSKSKSPYMGGTIENSKLL